MLEAEFRHPCPVCLGVKLSKLRIVTDAYLVLDRCERCGGVWFDAGEVTRLRTLRPEAAWQKVALAADAFRMQCHSCQAIMDRNAEHCPACRWRNQVDCPACGRPMERREVQGLHLDFCRACRGVWFDRIELAEIWNLHLDASSKRKSAALQEAATLAAGVGEVAAEVVFWNPELLVVGGRALGHGAKAAAELAGQAPEVLGAAVEAGGNLAGSVFEAIADIIGGIFN
jgi:Zn-finger nucleic acid-binding protein